MGGAELLPAPVYSYSWVLVGNGNLAIKLVIDPYPGGSQQDGMIVHWVGNSSGPHDSIFDMSGEPFGGDMYVYVYPEKSDTAVDITYTVNFATGGTAESAVCHLVLAASVNEAR